MNGRDEAPPVACWQLRVSGRVQGVGYREFCIDLARRLGLAGWVRNRRDGSVEALAIGPDDRLAQWRDGLRIGPPLARVTGLRVDRREPPWPRCEGFERLPTE